MKFEGETQDDLTKAPRRVAIFTARRGELEKADAALKAFKASDAREKAFVAAAKADLAEVTQLVAFDLKWAPGDTKAPDPPSVVPTRFSTLIESESAAGQKLLRACTVPADLARRTKAYGG